ncbi:thiol:disulfide interchange protein DsbD [Thiohalospira halophila DSM 15071]|uniref:Thiol:disulfide interchange protein DsbD n=2 Tax=Thiohalospira halophila TaxID=381300 RepID=A0A1I1N5W0_9GAMM|nr:protein-disulfide reductase DsbD [Thiohalospira halophila]SFC92835.1 thiol:disulfide interchange protein DsbD [Thiohalospira halophila DSM 15071]
MRKFVPRPASPGLLLFLLVLLTGTLASMPVQAQNIPQPEQAFQPSAEAVGPDTVRVTWDIGDDTYLYRDRLDLSVVEPEGAEVVATEVPAGKEKYDETFDQVMEVFRGEATLTAEFSGLDGADEVVVEARYQGCADAGVCYPPQTHEFPVSLTDAPATTAGGSRTGSGDGGGAAGETSEGTTTSGGSTSEQGQFADALESGGLLALGIFFLAGLGLAFTPCIFPMVPILSGIIVGSGGGEGGPGMSRTRALSLSLAYVLGVAITYALLGVIAGATGAAIQAALQNPWVIGAFAALFVALALSMFGFYELQLPSSLQSRLQQSQQRMKGGSLAGTWVMGVLSALIVGPCVAPPLAGALLYIGQSGDMLLGGTSLFAMSLGMGIPLLVVGTTAGSVMPRAGAWMNTVKYVFGVLLLGMAIFLLGRVVPWAVTLLLWGLLLIVSAVYLGAFDRLSSEHGGWQRLWKGLGLVLVLIGSLQIVGAFSGGEDPLDPLDGLLATSPEGAEGTHLDFRKVDGPGELQAALDEAAAAGRPVMLDFYADWCIECVRYERTTFEDPGVHQALANQDAVLLQADVTEQSDADKELQSRFNIIGPPSISFFNAEGEEICSARIAGYKAPEAFTTHVKDHLGDG